MTLDLALTLAGLALLDAVNTSTLFLVMVILLSAARPVATASAYAIGASVSFLGLALALYAGASAADGVVGDVAQWIRRGTLALLAALLVYLAYRRLRDRPRRPLTFPAWFGPLTAAPLGAAATVADLPNAFPLFIAVERLLVADVERATATVVLVAYTGVYALPIAGLVAVGAVAAGPARAWMARITGRFLSGTARRSVPIAALYAVASAAALALVPVV